MSDSDRPTVIIGEFCKRHQHDLIVRRLKMSEDGPWMSRLVVAQMLMFQFASTDEGIWKRAEGNAENLSLILAEIGCLGCWRPDFWRRMCRIFAQGWDHAVSVSKNETSDPDSPFRDAKPPASDADATGAPE